MSAGDHSQPHPSTASGSAGWRVRPQRPLRLLGLLLVTAALALLAGWTGLVVGLVVSGIGVVAPAPVAFGVGGVSLLVGTADEPLVYVLGAIGLLAVLVDPAVGAPTGRRVLAATAGGSVMIGVAIYGLLAVWSLPAVTIAVSLSIALIMYALHRYERVMLGLVTEGSNQ